MKLRQKIYDSNLSFNFYTKITNTNSLSRNLKDIKERKSSFGVNNYISFRKRRKNNILDYYVNQGQLAFTKVLEGIQKKEIKPKIEDNPEKIIHNCISLRKKYHKLKIIEIDKENEGHRRRINNQKSFLDIRSLEKEYNIRAMSKKKIKKIFPLLLPPINTSTTCK